MENKSTHPTATNEAAMMMMIRVWGARGENSKATIYTYHIVVYPITAHWGFAHDRTEISPYLPYIHSLLSWWHAHTDDDAHFSAQQLLIEIVNILSNSRIDLFSCKFNYFCPFRSYRLSSCKYIFMTSTAVKLVA